MKILHALENIDTNIGVISHILIQYRTDLSTISCFGVNIVQIQVNIARNDEDYQ